MSIGFNNTAGTRNLSKGNFSGVCTCAESLRSCLTLGDPTDWTPPGFSVHVILQARILEWVAISSSGDLLYSGIELASTASARESSLLRRLERGREIGL